MPPANTRDTVGARSRRKNRSPEESSSEAAPRERSEVQKRTIATARALFGEYGVGGTSMQMIADELGVTKAAIFHQFKSKEELIRATAEDPIRRLQAAVEAAEAEGSPERAHRVLLLQIVDLAIESRAIVRRISDDPALTQFVAANASFRDLMARLYRLLIGDDPSPRERVRAAGVFAAVNQTATHPLVSDLDDSTLRLHLLELVEEILDPPTPIGFA